MEYLNLHYVGFPIKEWEIFPQCVCECVCVCGGVLLQEKKGFIEKDSLDGLTCGWMRLILKNVLVQIFY